MTTLRPTPRDRVGIVVVKVVIVAICVLMLLVALAGCKAPGSSFSPFPWDWFGGGSGGDSDPTPGGGPPTGQQTADWASWSMLLWASKVTLVPGILMSIAGIWFSPVRRIGYTLLGLGVIFAIAPHILHRYGPTMFYPAAIVVGAGLVVLVVMAVYRIWMSRNLASRIKKVSLQRTEAQTQEDRLRHEGALIALRRAYDPSYERAAPWRWRSTAPAPQASASSPSA